jgi:transcriptional regulator with GAF, ATPase, and Fis domain
LAFIKKAAKSEANILFLGELGVGKELAARAIHCESIRKDRAFVKINWRNFNENPIENEPFGYRMAAFIGAFAARPNRNGEYNDFFL